MPSAPSFRKNNTARSGSCPCRSEGQGTADNDTIGRRFRKRTGSTAGGCRFESCAGLHAVQLAMTAVFSRCRRVRLPARRHWGGTPYGAVRSGPFHSFHPLPRGSQPCGLTTRSFVLFLLIPQLPAWSVIQAQTVKLRAVRSSGASLPGRPDPANPGKRIVPKARRKRRRYSRPEGSGPMPTGRPEAYP